MKTVRIISCLLLLCLFCLSACTEPGGETYDLGPETGTISFYVAGGPVELTLWDSLISKFEQQNPGIKVEKVLFSSYDTVFNALQAGNAPDVIQMANAYAGNWAKVGADFQNCVQQ
jgi:ABC-type glycerol-3-phosphate transport system substrate-binding protein